MSDSLRNYYLDQLGIELYELRPAEVEQPKPSGLASKRIDIRHALSSQPRGASAQVANNRNFAAQQHAPAEQSARRQTTTARPLEIPDASSLDWEALTQKITTCHACDLCAARRQTIIGQGANRARLMVIAEAYNKEAEGKYNLFDGAEGQLLAAMLFAAGFELAQIYTTPLLKCSLPSGRTALNDEITTCLPYLKRQIELVKPAIILALGRNVAQSLLGSNESLLNLRDTVQQYGSDAIPVVVTLSPAYLLRSPIAKAGAWKDLLKLKKHPAHKAGC